MGRGGGGTSPAQHRQGDGWNFLFDHVSTGKEPALQAGGGGGGGAGRMVGRWASSAALALVQVSIMAFLNWHICRGNAQSTTVAAVDKSETALRQT